MMRTEEECIVSEGHNVGTHAAAVLEDMYDSLIVTVEDTFACESWSLKGDCYCTITIWVIP